MAKFYILLIKMMVNSKIPFAKLLPVAVFCSSLFLFSCGENNYTEANAVTLTLTYWQTRDTDVGGLDPKIHFRVTAYYNGKSISNNNTAALLNEQDISNTWTGSKKSSPVPFSTQADSLIIRAVVVEKDTFSDDDISPGRHMVFYKPFYEGEAGSDILDYGSGLSKVGFNYEFVKQ